MNKYQTFVLSQPNNPLLAQVKNVLAGQHPFSQISGVDELEIEDRDRSLLQPPRVLVCLIASFDDSVIAEYTKLVSRIELTERFYSILYVIDGNDRLSQLLVTAIDGYILENEVETLLCLKITHLVERFILYKKLSRDLKEASDIALLSMSHSSELGEISRFILQSYNCRTYEELIEALLETIVIFNLSCSVLIVVDDKMVVRTADGAGINAKKNMLKYHGVGRIHNVDGDVIITFSHSSIMVHHMPLRDEMRYGRLLDNLAVLGNCFEARVKGIHAEEEADSASRAKTMFLATMSHELRTPMNSVIGFTERLIEKLDGRITAKEEKQLNAIKRNGDHLLSLINDILDISKIEVGKMEIHPEPVDVVECVNNIYVQLQPIASNHQLEFTLNTAETNIIISADPKRLTQMLMNLTSNAIKYTPKGKVDIKVDRVVDHDIGDSIKIDISDTGIGIAEEDRQKLFGNFVQIDSALTRKVEGTGLGLAISEVFATMHGGRIDVQSEVNVGTCFSLLLPTANHSNKPPAAASL